MSAYVLAGFPFDGDEVAHKFPGQLTFRGANSLNTGVTEISGEVDEDALETAVNAARLEVPDSVPALVEFIPPIPVPDATPVVRDTPAPVIEPQVLLVEHHYDRVWCKIVVGSVATLLVDLALRTLL